MKNNALTLRFSELLLALLKGKTNLLDALHVLARDGIEKQLRDSAVSLLAVMKKGKGLSESLAIINGERALFCPLYLTLIAAAELTGNIEAVLERIVIDLRRKQKARENLVNIMIYPAIIVLLALAGTIGIIVKGLPFFISGGLLSAAAIKEAKVGVAFAGLVLLLGGGALFTVYFKIFGNDSPESSLFYLLHFLMKSNVTLLEALSQCVLNLGQSKYAKALLKIKKDVTSGVSFSDAFAGTSCFPPYVLGWLSVADTQGNLSDVCENIKEFYVKKETRLREAAARLIEPAVIVLVGVYVLVIMVTVILPILSHAGGVL